MFADFYSGNTITLLCLYEILSTLNGARRVEDGRSLQRYFFYYTKTTIAQKHAEMFVQEEEEACPNTCLLLEIALLMGCGFSWTLK